MAERLAEVLEQLAKKGRLQAACDELEKAASASPKSDCPSFKSVSQLVDHYHKKQAQSRRPQSKTTASCSKAPLSKFFSLKFAKYRKAGRFGFTMLPPGKVQVAGFSNEDTHLDVITKGAKGLELDTAPNQLSLIISNGLVLDTPHPSGLQWTLGGYIDDFGGVQARSKRTFGLLLPPEEEEGEEEEWEEEGEVGNPCKDEQERRGNSRKRQRSCHAAKTTAPKLPKSSQVESTMGTNKDNPLILDSDEPLEIEFEESTSAAIYWPASEDKVFPGIAATGREGVWSLLRYEYRTPLGDVLKAMEEDFCCLQPESEGFILVALQSSSITYIKALAESKRELLIKDLKFFVKEKRLVHSRTALQLKKVPTPHHGNVAYKWERKRFSMDKWKVVDVPSWTCLLYVEVTGQFRCSVENSTVVFHVQAPRRSKGLGKQTTTTEVNLEEIQFCEIIGRGSYGTVHKGTWKGNTVALKCVKTPPGMDTNQMLTSNKEIAALRLINHPNIVSLLGYAVSPKEIVLIMNFVAWKNLHMLIFGKHKSISQASDEQKVAIAKSIADGVQFMHSQDPVIIHQDMKPLNVMVSDDLQGVYICDLGISKLKQASQATMTTVTKGPTGTIPYMAPEMFGPGHRGTGVDIYSLGCLYIELFGEKRVWGDLDGMQVMQKVCGSFNTPPVMPTTSHLPKQYVNVCEACCQLDPKNRPNITAVLKMLETCIHP